MSEAHKIALHGFTAFERATFESFFRLAARRPPGYQLVTELSQAALTVVNADDPAVLKGVIDNKPSPHVMLVGNSDGGTGWPLQKRPLNLMRVLTTVEQMLATGHKPSPISFAATQPMGASGLVPLPKTVPAAPTAQMQPGLVAKPSAPIDRLAVSGRVMSAQAAPTAPTRTSAPAPLGVDGKPMLTREQINRVRSGTADLSKSREDGPVIGVAATQPADFNPSLDYILVVDDSDIALKFMRNRLTRFGFSTDLVSSGEEALGRMNVRPYKFVFLDVMMEGLDGYQTCRAIKQRKYAEGKPPVVVMLTSRGGTIDKIRGTLAGCDAYLTKPLNERDLINVLAKHDRTVARGFQETNVGQSSRSSIYG